MRARTNARMHARMLCSYKVVDEKRNIKRTMSGENKKNKIKAMKTKQTAATWPGDTFNHCFDDRAPSSIQEFT